MVLMLLTIEADTTRFATTFIFCCYLILLQTELISNYYTRTESFHSTNLGRLDDLGLQQTSQQTTSCGLLIPKMDILELIFKWVPLMIWFVIWGNKDLFFFFRGFLNVVRFNHSKIFKLNDLTLFCDII